MSEATVTVLDEQLLNQDALVAEETPFVVHGEAVTLEHCVETARVVAKRIAANV